MDGDAGSTLREIHPGYHSLVREAVASMGRGRQMNRGAEIALADRLLFLHADSRLPQDGIVKISLPVGGAMEDLKARDHPALSPAAGFS